MGVGGYFMNDSVYSPLDQAILLRKQSEIMTLATLFDKQLETLWRRAEDFSSDGFIRTQTTSLISAPSPLDYIPEYLELLQHLRVNKLPIVHGFVDLQIYDMDLRQIVGLTGVA